MHTEKQNYPKKGANKIIFFMRGQLCCFLKTFQLLVASVRLSCGKLVLTENGFLIM